MSEIIKISSEVIGTEKTNSVNARELHQVLEIGKDFSNWMNAQINSLGLEKNVDYIVYEVKGNGRPQKEYIITTETAKHISMA
ncbi:AntA/AntB antirepressor [Aliarcobacter thereius]|uniref:AntA/AntB antirepressor n=1 Tax=Aliarcobacter thereius TaxID=544718 RepID=A0A1C0B7F2_9BACT|nr:antA/AntB antirepressor family protein [Aliarcobacter thereius]OCL99529.1 AntA/AntB antirepressor [Aliarcobacter thereius]